jgi:hypothetical protein
MKIALTTVPRQDVHMNVLRQTGGKTEGEEKNKRNEYHHHHHQQNTSPYHQHHSTTASTTTTTTTTTTSPPLHHHFTTTSPPPAPPAHLHYLQSIHHYDTTSHCDMPDPSFDTDLAHKGSGQFFPSKGKRRRWWFGRSLGGRRLSFGGRTLTLFVFHSNHRTNVRPVSIQGQRWHCDEHTSSRKSRKREQRKRKGNEKSVGGGVGGSVGRSQFIVFVLCSLLVLCSSLFVSSLFFFFSSSLLLFFSSSLLLFFSSSLLLFFSLLRSLTWMGLSVFVQQLNGQHRIVFFVDKGHSSIGMCRTYLRSLGMDHQCPSWQKKGSRR